MYLGVISQRFDDQGAGPTDLVNLSEIMNLIHSVVVVEDHEVQCRAASYLSASTEPCQGARVVHRPGSSCSRD